MDGVFYRGKEKRIKIGGTRIVAELRRRGRKLLVLTNNSTDTTEVVWSRLRDVGVPVRKNEILTSSVVTAQYLRAKYGRISYYLVGERGLEIEMARQGHCRVRGNRADFIIVGLDRRLSYEKLNRATLLGRHGAGLVATHIAPLYMAREGPAMATGPIVRALEYAIGTRAIEVGKPSPLMFRIALREFHCRARDAVMVGDQIDTDIDGATRAGVDSILVKTGVDKEIKGTEALAALSNVDDLVDFL